jgi:polyhydroxyalkanoate synthase
MASAPTTAPEDPTTSPTERAEPIDVLLADAALGSYRRFVPGSSMAKMAFALARRPIVVTRRGTHLTGELGRILVGTSQVSPSPRDRRFADPAWASNPLLRRLTQAYLAAGTTAQTLLADAELGPNDEARMRFVVDNLIEAFSPSNSPLTNPQALKAMVDTGGGNVLRGAKSLVRDMSSPPRIPAMVDTSPFRVGENLAATPGHVVARTEVFELIQYTPTTESVLAVPVVIVPPMINKFYAMDLAPGRSLVEHLVGQGAHVFMISWRNPDARHAAWGLDRYASAILDAMDAAERVTAQGRSVLVGVCSGGIVASMTAAHLVADGDPDRLAGLTLLVTVLNQSNSGLAGAVIDERTAELAAAASARRGYLDGRVLAEIFAWLRPGDLIWNYWVNNYLLGQPPPSFDILAWNADVTRMPARLHRDFLMLGLKNALVTPGAATVLGTPVDLGAVKADAYVVAGSADHLCDWRACYASTQLLGGQTRFVLSTSGHIAALVNPPGNPKARFQVSEDNPADESGFLATAEAMSGTWWTDYAQWLRDHCGPEVPAPTEPGGGGLESLGTAPGSYVFET